MEDLIRRFHSLEANQAKLCNQLDIAIDDGGNDSNIGDDIDSDSDSGGVIPGFFSTNPYRNVLDHLGHALHVSCRATGEIIYWNQTAEHLYGWKDYEALGQRVDDLIMSEESRPYLEKVMKILISGQSWSGRFPLRKRSGDMFIAMITKSPLYEDGEFVGVITVSSDVAVAILNDMNSQRLRNYWDQGHDQPRECKLNVKRARWPLQPMIPSSVLSLASKLFIRNTRSCDGEGDISQERCGCLLERGNASLERSEILEHKHADDLPKTTKIAKSYLMPFSKINEEKIMAQNYVSDKRIQFSYESTSFGRIRSEFSNVTERIKKVDAQATQKTQKNIKEDLSAQATLQKKHGSQNIEDTPSSTSTLSMESSSNSQAGSLICEDKDSNLVTDYDIPWEDLLLGEEIGEGFYAVVYRGVWNGSDVAIKVYLGKDYSERVLLDYRKEIAIMKRLRHPNVLLFMGAAYSPDRLAIVTELLPRGSLFRTIHKNNQALDMKRILRMALDIARGMNYLHRRKPPIIHRDLKSSNLLVDKNWNIKVADFGLSCLKISTFLTEKSRKGTPQWMAPEVLRGECTNEKSDVYSYGVVLWELMTGSVPWGNLNPLQVVGVVGFMDQRLDLPDDLDPRMSSIISDCWESDPKQRPDFDEIMRRMAALIMGEEVTKDKAHRRRGNQV